MERLSREDALCAARPLFGYAFIVEAASLSTLLLLRLVEAVRTGGGCEEEVS